MKLIPSPDSLPAPWGFFYFLLVLTFLLHLILANLVLGGAVISLVNGLRSKTQPWVKDVVHKIPLFTALTVNLGVAPLLFLQVLYGQYIYVSSVLMAVYWLSIFALIIIAYYAAYVHDFKFESWGRRRAWAAGVAAALFAVVGYLFTRSLLLMLNPQAWPQYFAHPWGAMMNAGDISLAPRYLHFFAASLALGGLGVALWGGWRKKQGDAQGRDMIDHGLVWYGAATMVNFIIGALYLATLPQAVLAQVFGNDKLAMYFLLVGVIAGLASIAAGFARQLSLATWGALVSVVLMVLFRYEVRDAYMAPYLKPASLPLATQTGAMLLFILIFLGGLALVAYMLKLLWNNRKEVRA